MSHRGHYSVFDWSGDAPSAIQWAAFYSDCEHEGLEVKTGHRVALTYNLYVSETVGGILQYFPTADPSLYQLFEGTKRMLQQSRLH